VLQTAELMVSTGLFSYGYQYVNIDSSWQGEYGGKFNAILPNDKFPDMAQLYSRIHELGLKRGIYSTPMVKAWGLKNSADGLPGCTLGEPDPKYPDARFSIGLERREENNVKQWCE
jgi:alpha-galactosidase